MPKFIFAWTDQRAEHLEEHGVSIEEFEAIVQRPLRKGISRSSKRPFAIGETQDGRTLLCVYEHIDEMVVEPITAYEIND